MLGTVYHTESTNDRVCYEIVSDPQRLALISVWKHNRPPDPARVAEIEAHIRTTEMCDGQVLLAVVGGRCVCYDGSHRLLACQNQFPESGMQVRILYNSTDEEVRGEFERVNRSIPVPELYFSEDEISTRVSFLAQTAAKSLCENYGAYVSTSRRPRRPHFNRDVFVEDLGTVLKESLKDEAILALTDDTVGTWLTEVNQSIRAHHYTGTHRIKASAAILRKCERQNLFLFAADWKQNLRDHLGIVRV